MSDDDHSPQTAEHGGGERIAKRLARAGLCSRRDAERWIAEGRVVVNGRTLDTAAVVVKPGDRIVVDGKTVGEPEPTRVWRYHKPAGLVTTARDEKGRRTVFEMLPPELPRVMSVGRLDLNSEGLMLLTNDGALARHLELPTTGWLRRYRVRVHGMPTQAMLASLADGIVVEGVVYGPIEAALDRQIGANAWITIGLREGKNREVRRVMEHLGLPVSRLIRLAYGPFQLGKLDPGAVEEVPRRILRDQLPAFFPKEDRNAPPTGAAAPVRMRYDRLPKGKAEAAPPSATKGGGKPGGAKAGQVKAARPKIPRPSAIREEYAEAARKPGRGQGRRPSPGTDPGTGPGSGGPPRSGGSRPGASRTGAGTPKTGGRPGGRNADRRR